jgi:hypothetical protein
MAASLFFHLVRRCQVGKIDIESFQFECLLREPWMLQEPGLRLLATVDGPLSE